MARIWPKSKLARREALWFYFFISPWIIGFLLFTGGPIIVSLLLSFTQYNVSKPAKWVGLENFTTLFQDDIFYKSLQVSSYYTALAVPVGIAAALILAVLLNQKVPVLGVFRTVYYIPSLISGSVAVAILFQWLLNPSSGVVNYVISRLVGPNGLIPLGIIGPGWFFAADWVIPAFVIMSLWGLGSTMIIYLAALQGVPTALYEAATIDGAGAWQRFRNVTLPMISPVILFTFITGVIGSFQVFTPAYVISGGTGGPSYASMFYVLYLYLNAFRRYRFGYSAAQAWILFTVILILTYFMLQVSRRTVYYETSGDEKGI